MIKISRVLDTGKLEVILEDFLGDAVDLSSLDQKDCLIIQDDHNKVIWLWKGRASAVRQKFMGAKKVQEVRARAGLNYTIQAIDGGEEPPAFVQLFHPRTSSITAAGRVLRNLAIQFDVSEEGICLPVPWNRERLFNADLTTIIIEEHTNSVWVVYGIYNGLVKRRKTLRLAEIFWEQGYVAGKVKVGRKFASIKEIDMGRVGKSPDMKKDLDILTNLYQLPYEKIEGEVVAIEIEQKTDKNHEERERAKREADEKARIEKLRKIVKVSNSLEIARMAAVLSMDEKLLWDKIFDWADQFGFRIEKDMVIFAQGNTAGFIDALDKQFSAWQDLEHEKEGKISVSSKVDTCPCPICGANIPVYTKECPACHEALKWD